MAGLVALAAGSAVLYACVSERLEFVRWRLPVFGRIIRESALARVSTRIGWLVDSGVTLHESIGLVSDASPSVQIRRALGRARGGLSEGVAITKAVGDAGVFGSVFVRAVALGDESGRIAEILMRLGERYRRSAVRSLDRLTNYLEPAAIIFIAALIGFVAYASIMPMLRVSENLY